MMGVSCFAPPESTMMHYVYDFITAEAIEKKMTEQPGPYTKRDEEALYWEVVDETSKEDCVKLFEKILHFCRLPPSSAHMKSLYTTASMNSEAGDIVKICIFYHSGSDPYLI